MQAQAHACNCLTLANARTDVVASSSAKHDYESRLLRRTLVYKKLSVVRSQPAWPSFRLDSAATPQIRLGRPTTIAHQEANERRLASYAWVPSDNHTIARAHTRTQYVQTPTYYRLRRRPGNSRAANQSEASARQVRPGKAIDRRQRAREECE